MEAEPMEEERLLAMQVGPGDKKKNAVATVVKSDCGWMGGMRRRKVVEERVADVVWGVGIRTIAGGWKLY